VEEFKITPVFGPRVAKAHAVSQDHKDVLVHTHSQRDISWPMSEHVKSLFQRGLDLPENCPAKLQPGPLDPGKLCKCDLQYNGKLVHVSDPAVYYPLGRARRKMELWAYDCPNRFQACRIYPTGENELLHVSSHFIVLCDAIFYNTLEMVSIC
jgi:hypothetical protein